MSSQIKEKDGKPSFFIMCLYPIFIKNKRYLSYISKKPKKAQNFDYVQDFRKMYVPVGCGHCYECRKQKAQQWRVRLMEEMKIQKYAYFVTLTFDEDNLQKLIKTIKDDDPNKVATKATRLFLERWRKKHNTSVKHWLITELGHENTERIHLHGILFPDEPLTNDILHDIWKYGRTDIGAFCNEMTINYIVKYVTKIDIDHKGYKSIVLCSAGLGKNFIDRYSTKQTYVYRPKKSAEYYTLKNGTKVALPIYYRNKLYTREERDRLWTERLDRHRIYVNGIPIDHIDTAEGYAHYIRVLQEQQKWNEGIGYGNRDGEWDEKKYKAAVQKINS